MEAAFGLLSNRLKHFGVYSKYVADRLMSLGPVMRRFDAGQEIVERHSNRTHHVLVQSGWISTHRDLSDGRRQILTIDLPGTLSGLVSSRPVAYSVTSLTAAEVLLFPDAAFSEAVGESEHLRRAINRLMAHEQSILAEHLVNVGQRSAAERLLHFLLETRHRLAATGTLQGNILPLPVPQSILGLAMGLTNVHTNRTLQVLKRLGVIEACARNALRIANIEHAAEICGFDSFYLE
jgi:CRP-like cAMP-binding protein